MGTSWCSEHERAISGARRRCNGGNAGRQFIYNGQWLLQERRGQAWTNVVAEVVHTDTTYANLGLNMSG